jgi:MbtH protein
MVRPDPVTDGAVVEDLDDAFLVVRNDEGQYCVWWQDRPVPAGWVAVGEPGPREACLDRIGRLWTDPGPVPVRARVAGPEWIDDAGPDGDEAPKPGVAKPGVAEPGVAEPGVAEPGVAEPGVAEPGVAEPVR